MFSQVGLLVAALVTLLTLSYAFGDNRFFRIVLYLFVGVAAGYAGAVAIEDIVLPYLIFPLFDILVGNPSIDLIELSIRGSLSILLFTKLFRRTARLGNPATAFLTGVGAALAVSGAIQGTILPQIASASGTFNVAAFQFALQSGYYGESIQIILEGVVLLLGTVSALAYFHFGAKTRGAHEPSRSAIIETLAWIGSIFIAISLASLFSGVLQAALGALIERISFLVETLSQLSAGF
ncbi:MAG: hypothetical protein ACRDFQ_04330 [Anaerolineales bacterium]